MAPANKVFEIERLVKRRVGRKGTYEYFIHWKGVQALPWPIMSLTFRVWCSVLSQSLKVHFYVRCICL